jgi:hypothetical protein
VSAERVLGRIRAEGALSALDFEPEHGAPKDWFGMPENVVRAVLEAYTVAEWAPHLPAEQRLFPTRTPA